MTDDRAVLRLSPSRNFCELPRRLRGYDSVPGRTVLGSTNLIRRILLGVPDLVAPFFVWAIAFMAKTFSYRCPNTAETVQARQSVNARLFPNRV